MKRSGEKYTTDKDKFIGQFASRRKKIWTKEFSESINAALQMLLKTRLMDPYSAL